ncbi:MAG: murein L,D-transpeptidase catalytic domain family protein [Gammaproteobacteria bacterium]|nr:murein L,D-transpeptidase catalytic domain family protein [Gammaproteobacteria bacterium]
MKKIIAFCGLVACIGYSLSSFANYYQVDNSKIFSEIPRLVKQTTGLRPEVLRLAFTAYKNAYRKGIAVKRPILTVIDYSIPASEKRLWVLSLSDARVLYHTLVAHGKNSGTGLIAKRFSDRPGTEESSLGLYLTGNTYFGHRGLSLRLDGLDRGFNGNAERRAIVMHGAWYVSHRIFEKYGTAGRSWGCPAVPIRYARPVINTIKNGTLVFAYYPEKRWLDDSKYLHA